MTKTCPFEWLDDSGVITTKVRINGKDNFDFLLDTGSSDTYLDKNIILIENISLKNLLNKLKSKQPTVEQLLMSLKLTLYPFLAMIFKIQLFSSLILLPMESFQTMRAYWAWIY
jgi:hypothetical protein